MVTPGQKNILYEFDSFRLSPTERLLLRGGRPVALTARALDVLMLLVENRGRIVERDEIFKTIWGDTFVEEINLTVHISALRKALGESPSDHRYIDTVPKRGYRFVADVRVVPLGQMDVLLTTRTGTRIVIEKEEEGDADTLDDISRAGVRTSADPGFKISRPAANWRRVVAAVRNKVGVVAASSTKSLTLIALLALLVASVLVFRYVASPGPGQPFRKMSMLNLTASGRARLPAAAPDGSYAAYVVEEDGLQSLWVHQVATTSRTQVVAPGAVEYRGVTFSPDGQFIFYIVFDQDHASGVLNQVPVLGGTVRKVMTGIDSPVTFSPDGRRFAFVRGGQVQGETSLITANVDGTGEQTLATHKRPDSYATTGPAWSPDGSVIACGAWVSDSRRSFGRVVIVQIADGSEAPLGSHTWALTGQVAWLGDGSGVVAQAWPRDSPVFADQLWYLSYPAGEMLRVTRDLSSYEAVSIAAHADIMLAWRSDRVSRILVAPRAIASRATQIRTGSSDNYSEFFGLDWTPDGRIVYGSHVGGNADIWIMDGDGGNPRQLTFDQHRETWPVVSADGRQIVFVAQGPDGVHLWRIDADGGNRKQLTQGKGESFPSLSPDGRWVYFTSMELGHPVVARVSINGGETELVTRRPSGRPVVSPDGESIAYVYQDEQTSRTVAAILPLNGGESGKAFRDMPPPDFDLVRWTPDGRALAYISTRDGVANIWAQPLAGGPPQKLTDFKRDLIYRFAWSRDGKDLAVDLGSNINDVILMSGYR
jgi:Tol biopolymer transport system component/DNA-binding winged helix-turn-helix (wHTH) protein